MLRVKDESRTIHDTLTNLTYLCDYIVGLDNGSTDGTEEIWKYYPKVIHLEKMAGYDEGRDIRLLYKIITEQFKPEWVIYLAGDEVLDTNRETLDALITEGYAGFAFPVCHFWKNKLGYRIDGRWKASSLSQMRMWQVQGQERFSDKTYDIGLPMDLKGLVKHTEIKLLHYGYIFPDTIRRKHRRYIERFGGQVDYSHLLDEKGLEIVPFP